jgi:hypothetical protein
MNSLLISLLVVFSIPHVGIGTVLLISAAMILPWLWWDVLK